MPYDIIIGRDDADKERFGKRGLIYLGKGFVRMGTYTSLSNLIYMDIARSHVILVSGKRGSGKSYTLGVIAEELSNLDKEARQNVSSLIFDTMGIYWTMRYKNEKEKILLEDWNLKSQELAVNIFVPYGFYDKYVEQGIPVDHKFALDIKEMNAEDWILTFGLDFIHPVAVLIERTLLKLKEEGNYILDDIINSLKQDETSEIETKNAAIGLFEATQSWGIFANSDMTTTQISELVNAGTTTVLDLSVYNSVGAFNIRALVISLVSRKLFNQRMTSRKKEETEAVAKGIDYLSSIEKRDEPLIWLFIDEAHEFLPLHGKTIASDALIQLLREGRQPGISLVLATQQPGQIHTDAMTQADIVISHRVTSQPDLNALNYIMQNYLLDDIKKYMNDLPNLKGSALILDDNSERIYQMRVRPRFTWHGGESPTAIKIEKRL